MTARLVVIGAGLAGMAAALRLAEHGEKPLLIETRKKLGGRATSFIDPRNDLELDNCQHVVLGCCTNLLDFYARTEVLDHIEWHRTLYWTAGDGEIDTIRPGLLPAPFHLARSFGGLRFLDRTDRAAIRRAMWRLIRLGPAGRQRYIGRSFRTFLDDQKQTLQAVDRFWNTVIVSACNLDVEHVDAACAMQVFQDGFLANRFGFVMGLPNIPLQQLYDPVIERIESLGGDVVDGVSAQSIAYSGQRVNGVVTRDGMINASKVVAAVPFDRLAKLVSGTMQQADARLQKLDQLKHSPILGVHLWFENTVMKTPHLVLVGMGVQWLFNKGTNENGVQHVHAVISAADDWMEFGEDEIVQRVMRDIHRALPHARGLEPKEARAVKEKRATFASVPGVEALRPSAAPGTVGIGGGGIRNLFLCGDWCNTGWPATMEGAVRSGYEAASAITGTGGPIGDLPPGVVSRILGLKQSGGTAG